MFKFMYYENYEKVIMTLWKNFNFFKKISFSQKLLFKNVVPMRSPPTPLCVCILTQSLLILPHFLQPLKSMVGRFLTQIFFFTSWKMTLPNLRFWVQWIKQVAESFFDHSLKLFGFSRKLLPKSEILV